MKNNQNPGIRELIINKRGDRSLEALSRACGGTPTRANLDRLINREVLSWPKENDVITGLAKGLGVRVIDVVTAYAGSLGLPITADVENLNLPGAGALPESSQRVLREMSENMLWWQEQTELSSDRVSSLQSQLDEAMHEINEYKVDRYMANENEIPEKDRISSGQSKATQIELALAADKGEKNIDPEQLPED